MKTFFDRRIVQVGSVLAAVFIGYVAGHLDPAALMQGIGNGDRQNARRTAAATQQTPATAPATRPGAVSGAPIEGTQLPPYPPGGPGVRTPFDLYKYAGRGASSWGTPALPMTFDAWLAFHRNQKPKLMADVRAFMASRYDFSGTAMPGVTMTRGKPIMLGPVARLAAGVTFDQLSRMTAEEIKARDAFPYKPLAHPLQTTAHMVFPAEWTKVHPEHERIDVDLDIPDQYLPEFPPPMFLTTHKELGDVTKGKEITLQNYFSTFNGLLTAEQMEGLKELLRPTATTWFNQTEFRVTAEPSNGVTCFSCHVNGHTNGAIALAPDSRPNQARLRVDTPSLRGNFDMMQLSSKRSIRSMDHFSEVEEYFDGDQGMMIAIGPRAAQRQVTNRMGDFNALLDFPPAPKLSPLMKLTPEKSTPSELRGETLFHGKAQCAACHSGPAFTDDYMHDLQVERFYTGRPEGPIKTFALRGIKDSPPYLHDGRLPTLQDAVEFFDMVLGLRLNKQEKEDLVAYLLCL
jgi:cytochrome c peroxidase